QAYTASNRRRPNSAENQRPRELPFLNHELKFANGTEMTTSRRKGSKRFMNTISYAVAALAVATIFYAWRAYVYDRDKRELNLRDRVAYMLWVMANQAR